MSRASALRLPLALVSGLMIIAITVNQVPDATALAIALGLIPVLVFLGVTYRSRVVMLTVCTLVLTAYTFLSILGALSYDSSSTGGLVFVFFPLYGVLGLLLALGGRALFAAFRSVKGEGRPFSGEL